MARDYIFAKLNIVNRIELSIHLSRITMSDIIKLSAASFANATYHYGSDSNYVNHKGAWFSSNPDNGIKHVITNVKYEPDSVYRMVDGYSGRCWIVTVYDSKMETFVNYYIRNWVDIVHYYNETLGLVFVDASSKN